MPHKIKKLKGCGLTVTPVPVRGCAIIDRIGRSCDKNLPNEEPRNTAIPDWKMFWKPTRAVDCFLKLARFELRTSSDAIFGRQERNLSVRIPKVETKSGEAQRGRTPAPNEQHEQAGPYTASGGRPFGASLR